MMYLYRRSKGLPPKPTRGKILQGNLRAALWLEYMAWSGSGVETHHTLQEGATLRVRDLENQLFEEPAALRPWLSALADSPNSSSSSYSSSSRSSIDETLPVKSNTSERPDVSQPQISTADGTGSATTKKNNGRPKIPIHNSISSAHSAGPSRMLAADKTRRGARHVLTTPPTAHRPTSSNENKSPRLPPSHSYMFPLSVEGYPTRSARTRSRLRTSSTSYASSNIYPSLALD